MTTQTTFTRRGIAGVAIFGALAGAWISPGRAYAVQVEPADRDVDTVRVSYAAPYNRAGLFVELNNGAAYTFRPCVHEDGSAPTPSGVQRGGCYWDASDRGNGIGRSFVVLPSGAVVVSRMVGDAR